MIHYLDEPIPVEARLRSDGTPWPLAFFWQDRRYVIESWGRERIETDDGQAIHRFLVQTPGPETWELAYHKKTAQWVLTRHWAAHYRIV
jgi:hypothetical protein